jgi:hypothetical protein
VNDEVNGEDLQRVGATGEMTQQHFFGLRLLGVTETALEYLHRDVCASLRDQVPQNVLCTT